MLSGLIPGVSYAAESLGRASEEIRAALEEWAGDFNNKNTDKVCGLFAPDLMADYGDFPQISCESICKQLKSSLTNPKMTFRYSLEIKEIMVSGDLTVVRLIWILTVTDADGKVVEKTKDRGMDIFRRQTGWGRKLSRYIAYQVKGD